MPVLSGAEGRFPDAATCLRGEHWRWDEVSFEALYLDAEAPAGGNDASCVLKVSGAGGSALLTWDIMKKSEQRLLALDAPALKTDLPVAPYHGSNSSSTPAFVPATAPTEVLFPVGHRNRWGFPNPGWRRATPPLGRRSRTASTTVR